MDFKPCKLRNQLTVINRDGTEQTRMRCAHKSCESFTKQVTPEICNACPLRTATDVRPEGYSDERITERDFGQPVVTSEGWLIYPRTGFEPPVVPEGYAQKNKDPRSPDAWVFIPLWPECDRREMANHVRPCGCVKINAVCLHPESKYNNRRVTIEICKACPLIAHCASSVPSAASPDIPEPQ